jgi:ABC-type transport system involved in multi-copper enzyme maturation permease subunit
MIGLSWRQFRAQALIGLIALALVAAYLVYTGLDIRNAYDGYLAQCRGTGGCADVMSRFQTDYRSKLLYLAALLALIPALLGMFWGAPLIAKELEAGTHRLVWNQSVTRRRWFGVKLLFVGLFSMAMSAVASILLTWAASPFDRVADDRFGTIVFGARNIAPIAYAALAFVLGAIIGMLIRRTIPAMALTIFLFIVFQFIVPNLIRPHLMPPERLSMPMTAEAINAAQGLGSLGNAPVVKGLSIPDAWITNTSELLTADSRALDTDKFNDCLERAPKTGATGTFGDVAPCLANLNLHVDIAYQPNNRYWAFQWIESAIYLALSGLLAAFGLWRIQRPLN